MQVGEQKKDGNLYLDLSSHWQEGQSLGRPRSRVLWPSPAQSQNTWLSSTPSRNRSGSRDCSVRWDTILTIRTSSTLTARAPLHWPRILSIMQGPNKIGRASCRER